MALRYNEETQQVEKERVEYDVVDRNALQARVDELTSQHEQATADAEAATNKKAELEAQLEEAKSDLGEFDAVAPQAEEVADDESAEPAGEGESGEGEGDTATEIPVDVQF